MTKVADSDFIEVDNPAGGTQFVLYVSDDQKDTILSNQAYRERMESISIMTKTPEDKLCITPEVLNKLSLAFAEYNEIIDDYHQRFREVKKEIAESLSRDLKSYSDVPLQKHNNIVSKYELQIIKLEKEIEELRTKIAT